jgi:hypothetical protein
MHKSVTRIEGQFPPMAEVMSDFNQPLSGHDIQLIVNGVIQYDLFQIRGV